MTLTVPSLLLSGGQLGESLVNCVARFSVLTPNLHDLSLVDARTRSKACRMNGRSTGGRTTHGTSKPYLVIVLKNGRKARSNPAQLPQGRGQHPARRAADRPALHKSSQLTSDPPRNPNPGSRTWPGRSFLPVGVPSRVVKNTSLQPSRDGRVEKVE